MNKSFYSKLKNFYLKTYDIFDFNSKSILAKNKNLKLKKDRCFLIATGASLLDFDLDLIENEFKIGFGFCFLHPQIKKGFLDSYVFLDNYFNNNENINFPQQIIKKDCDKAYSFYNYVLDLEIPNLFINYKNRKILKKIFGNKFDDSFYFKVNPNENEIEHTLLNKRFKTFPSTIVTTIQIAISMGFKEIYMLGSGYTYSPVNLYHFYDSFSESSDITINLFNKKAKEFIKKRKIISDKDIGYMNHVSKFNRHYGLFFENRKSNDSHYIFHKKVKEFADNLGVSIFNVTPKNFSSPIYTELKSFDIKKILNQ